VEQKWLRDGRTPAIGVGNYLGWGVNNSVKEIKDN
jgi:hypothetical protein